LYYGLDVAPGKRKSEPFSIRLDETTMAFVDHEARRTRRSKSAIVEALTEEAARQRRFPGISFRGDDVDRRAWVIGRGLDVWEIVELRADHDEADDAVLDAHPSLDGRALRLAQAYYESYRDEIDSAIAANRAPLAELIAAYPFLDIVTSA
jgi:uncharacterized protein (DUF433 family)